MKPEWWEWALALVELACYAAVGWVGTLILMDVLT